MSLKTSRRRFIQQLAAAATVLPGAIAWGPGIAGRLDRIGIQLYSVRDLFLADMPGTLAQLRDIGYEEVELAGWGEHSITAVKAALFKTGMKCPSAHVSLERLRESLSEVLDQAKALDLDYIVCPWIEEEFRNPAGYRQVAAMLNQAGNVAGRTGRTVAYHNQAYDFADLGGTTGFDILIKETDPEVVKLELDVYWIRKGGGDPLFYLEKHRSRFRLMHIKDMAVDGSMADVGAGTIDWKAVLAAANHAGVQHYFVEHDEPLNPMGFAQSSYTWLHRLRW